MKTFLKFTALSAVLLMLAGGLSSCTNNENGSNEGGSMGTVGELFAVSIGSRNAPFRIIDENATERATLCHQVKWPEFEVDDKIITINSEEELKNHINCRDNTVFPTIDFSKYTLLMARGTNSTYIRTIRARFSQKASNEHILFVDIQSSAAHAITQWATLLLVPKLSEQAVISLEINRKASFQ